MRVKVRAVICLEERLVVASQIRSGREELSLPGGRVAIRESVLDALRREVAEETGLEIVPGPLLYVSENVSVVDHELELVFRAWPAGVPALNGFRTIDLRELPLPAVRPPILPEIVLDASTEWRDTPRWLGDLTRRPVHNH
jgi:ADP-ribose pyrophosphatase YjhB (NUDIX family)